MRLAGVKKSSGNFFECESIEKKLIKQVSCKLRLRVSRKVESGLIHIQNDTLCG